MGKQNTSKVNQLVQALENTGLVSARWLRANGYSTSLVARYVRSGWLTSPARGVYALPRSAPSWDRVLRTLQQCEGLRVHVGGRFALAWQGHEHYMRLAGGTEVTVYGPDRLPGWATQIRLSEPLVHKGVGPFAPPTSDFADDDDGERLHADGLQRSTYSDRVGEVVMSSAERAMLELCDEKPSAALVYETDAVMQGLVGLRPNLVNTLLRACRSVKAKRLFLALAERHGHAWLQRVDLADVNLGSGKRVLVQGGRLHPKYLVTLPADLGEQLG